MRKSTPCIPLLCERRGRKLERGLAPPLQTKQIKAFSCQLFGEGKQWPIYIQGIYYVLVFNTMYIK
jgi:hypothetical protein